MSFIIFFVLPKKLMVKGEEEKLKEKEKNSNH